MKKKDEERLYKLKKLKEYINKDDSYTEKEKEDFNYFIRMAEYVIKAKHGREISHI